MLCTVHGALRRALRCALRSHSRHLAQVMGGSSDHKGKRSQGGKGCTGSMSGKSSKGNQGSSQGSKGGKGSPDGGLSPPQPNPSSRNQLRWQAKQKPKTCIGGISAGEGAWRLDPLPEDRVLKVLVPFLGSALCCDDENGSH